VETDDALKQCHKWQKSSMNVRAWGKELKEMCKVLFSHLCERSNKAVIEAK
jgi:hypothetical protein